MEIELRSGPEPGGDAMGAWLAEPETPNGSAVVVLMEAFGVNDHIRSICDRFAARGALAIAPDLYHRDGHFITGDYAEPAGVMGHFANLSTASMQLDIEVAHRFVSARDGIDPDRIGVIGFCLGGYGAVLAGVSGAPAIVAGFYGAGLAIRREGSPLDPLVASFGSVDCPVLLFYGADDPVIPAVEVEAVRRGLDDAAVDHTVTVYPGAGHGFFCDARASFRPVAADDAWNVVTERFARALGWSR